MEKNSLRHYTYRAVSPSHQIISGRLSATSPQDLYLQLQKRGIALLNQRPETKLLTLICDNKIPTQELIDLCLHLSYMDKAGVPLLDSLDDAKATLPKLKPILEIMIEDIKNGDLLSQALSSHPKVFSAFFCSIIKLSEKTGKLSEGFLSLYTHLTWIDQNKKELSKNLRYPLLIFFLLGFAIWLLLSVVMPGMQELLVLSGTESSVFSKGFMVISRYLSTWGLHFLGIISLCLLLIITTRLLIPSQRLWQDRLFLKLPIIGPLCKMKELTYFLHFFSVGANTKLPLLDNLHLSAQPVKNIWIKHCLFKLKEKVQNGESISQAFRTINLFDQTTVRLIQVGEVSGHLTSTLETLQEYQTHSLKRQINKILSLVQPCLLGLVGLILIWIVLGVFYPLYDQLITLEGQI